MLSERDRRFAFLIVMMSPAGWRGRRRPLLRRETIMDSHEQPVVTEANKERVRAGVTGHNVRYVLLASLALVVLVFIAVAAFLR